MQEMEIQAVRPQGAGAVRTNPVGWRNLREWIELVERAGMLHRGLVGSGEALPRGRGLRECACGWIR